MRWVGEPRACSEDCGSGWKRPLLPGRRDPGLGLDRSWAVFEQGKDAAQPRSLAHSGTVRLSLSAQGTSNSTVGQG